MRNSVETRVPTRLPAAAGVCAWAMGWAATDDLLKDAPHRHKNRLAVSPKVTQTRAGIRDPAPSCIALSDREAATEERASPPIWSATRPSV